MYKLNCNLIGELINVLKHHQHIHSLEFFRKYKKPFNLNKKRVDDILSSNGDEIILDFAFEDYINEYCRKLLFKQLVIVQELKQKDIHLSSSRLKQPQSRLSKLMTYRFEKKEKGKMSINKCLNDLFGVRFICEFDELEQALEILSNHFSNEKRIKFIKKDNYGYKAIHIYIYGENNSYFPWEIQIWNYKDEESNKISHSKHKQGYLEWTETLNKQR